MSGLSVEDKHKLYEASVQNAEFEVDFLIERYKELNGSEPILLREDFAGTGMVCCEWVKRNPAHKAVAIDLDPEPIAYGKKRHLSKLTTEEQDRVIYKEENVLNTNQKADIIVAFNFSYQIFKKRSQMVEYFKQVRDSLNPNGIFYIDLLGGPDSQTLCEEETEHDDFSYFWDCDKFNPITNECLFHIHFKYKGKKHRNVFTYDWRLWTIPELREIMEDAGFSKSVAYWEEDEEDGDGGNGHFFATEEAENCPSWVTYIAAKK